MNYTLKSAYYQSGDVVRLARSFLGKVLHTSIDGLYTSGKIVEVEAYCGATDRACHAYPNKITPRTSIMYKTGGIAYVYLVYGMHHLFNIVTNKKGRADAVLIRAIEPIEGLDLMMQRRNSSKNNKLLTGGPGRLSQAMGISIKDNGESLTQGRIWLSEGGKIADDDIIESTRIGVEYAGADALLPWRFHIKGNKYVSK